MPSFIRPDYSRWQCSQFAPVHKEDVLSDIIFVSLLLIDLVIISVYVILLVGQFLRKKVSMMIAIGTFFLLLNSIFIAAVLLLQTTPFINLLKTDNGTTSFDFADISAAMYELALIFYIIHFWYSVEDKERKMWAMVVSVILLLINAVAFIADAFAPNALRNWGVAEEAKRIIFAFTFLIQGISLFVTYAGIRNITLYKDVHIWRWQRAYVHFLLIFTGTRAITMFCIRLLESFIGYVPGQPTFNQINIFLQALSYIVFTQLVLIVIALSTFILNQDYFLRIGLQRSPGTLLDPTGSTHIQTRALTPKQKKFLILAVVSTLYLIGGFWSAHETCRAVGNNTRWAHLIAKGSARVLTNATIFEIILILPQVLAVIRGAKWGIIFNVLDMIEYHVYNGIIIFICTCTHTGAHFWLLFNTAIAETPRCLCLDPTICAIWSTCYWFPFITGIMITSTVFIITAYGYFMHKRVYMKSYTAKHFHRVLAMVYVILLLLHPGASILDLPVYNTSVIVVVLVVFISDYVHSKQTNAKIVSFAVVKDSGRGDVALPYVPEPDKGNPLVSLSQAELENDLILVVDIEGPIIGSIRGKYFDIRYAETHFHPFTIASYNKKRNRLRFFIKIDPVEDRWTNVLLNILKAETDWVKILGRDIVDNDVDNNFESFESSSTPDESKDKDILLSDVGRGDHQEPKRRDILLSRLTNVDYPIYLQGPFSSPIRNVLCLPEKNESERLCFVLISGGSGVTVATSFLQDIFENARSSSDSLFYVTFGFSTRNRKFLALIYEKIRNLTLKYPDCGTRIHLRVYLYHTKGSKVNIDALTNREKTIFKIKSGRMNCQNIIQKAGAKFSTNTSELSTVRIVVCSTALSEATRVAVDNLYLAPREGLFYDFTYEVF